MVIDHMLISKYKYESKSVPIPFDRKKYYFTMLCVIILEGGTKNARSVCTVVVSSPYNLRSKINLFIIIVLFVHFQYPSCQVCHRRFHAYQLYCSMLPLCFRFAVLLSSSFVILNVFANLHQKHGKKLYCHHLK